MSTPTAESPSKVLQCKKSTYRSENQDLLDRHMASHTADQPFECTKCDFTTLGCSRFVAHLAFHQQTGEIQCPFCPYMSPASTMKVHMLTHRAMEIFDCSTCEFTSSNAKLLKHHTDIYHNALFKCEYCRKRMTKHSLIEHWDESHGIREVSAENPMEPGTHRKDAPLLNPGSKCLPMYPAVILKTENAQDDFINDVDTQGMEEEAEFETGEFRGDIEKFYSCSICEFSSHLKVLLKFHVFAMHTKNFSCKNCSAIMTKHALIQHYKNDHRINVYFDGKGLQKEISHSKELGSLVHSGDFQKSENWVQNPKKREFSAKMLRSGDKFICSICKYSSKSNIESHIDKLHRRMFFCNECPAIMTKYALVEHSRLKHGVTLSLKNRFIVEAKPGMYSRPSSGSGGEESDEVSEMDTDRANVRSNPLPPNVSIIEEGDQFICSICRYSVTVRATLMKHIDRIHVRKYHCKYCSIIMTKHELVEHSMTMHGITLSTKTAGLKEFREGWDETSESIGDCVNGGEFDNGYEDSPSLTSHTIEVHEDGNAAGAIKQVKQFACSICDFSSHNEWSLTCHMKLLHSVKYHCNHCPAIMTKHDIMKHSLNVHGIEIRRRGPSGLREARGDLERNDIQKLPVTLPAEKLSSVGNFRGHFMDHKQTHLDSKSQDGTVQTKNPSSCTICSFIGRDSYNMRAHMVSFHTKKFCCPHCPAVLTKYKLIDHAWSAHGVTIRKNLKLKEAVEIAISSDDDDEMDSECDQGTSFQDKSTSKKPCPFCNHTANDRSLKVHVERMHYSKYHCEYCSVVMTKYELIKHYEKEHGFNFGPSGYRWYKFKKTDTLTDGQVPKKTASHSNGASKVCSFCDYTSTYSYNVSFHEDTMHKVKYICEHCPLVLTKYDLIRHYKNEHSIDDPIHNRGYKFRKATERGDNSPGPSKFVNRNSSNTSQKTCSFCDYKSCFAKDITTHEERMHRLKFHCGLCPVVMVKYNLLQHNKIKHGVVLPSNHRFKEAKNLSRQDDRMEVQSNEECSELEASSFQTAFKNECSFCGYTGNHVHHVQTHIARMHTKKFRCKYCPAVMTKYELLQHYKNLHGINVPDKGRGMNFVEASTEEIPGITSVDQRPATAEGDSSPETSGHLMINNHEFFKCSICDFSTKYEPSLEVHMEKWHERKYVCNNCPAVMSKYKLIEHSKDAHGIIIPRLGKPSQAFKPADDLIGQTQPNDEPSDPQCADSGYKADATGKTYKCNRCEYSAIHRKSMLLHVINMHRKKYSCKQCSTVLSKYELIVHSKDVHGINIPENGRGYVFEQFTKEGWNNDFQTNKNSKRDLSIGNDLEFSRDDETGKFKCPKCEFSSLYPYNLKCHVENMHEKLFCCNNCSVVKTKYDLFQHYEKEHNIHISNTRCKGWKEYQPGSDQVDSSRSELDKSMHTQDASMCATDDDESEFIHSVMAQPKSSLKPEIMRELPDSLKQFINFDGEKLNCSVCSFSSKYKHASVKHINSLHLRKFKCGSCSDVMTKYDLIRHYKNSHDVTICSNGRGYTFQEVNEEAEHTDTTDEPEFTRAESRNECANELNEQVQFKRNGEDFICSGCGWSSKYKYSMQCHVSSMHTRKYSCKSCPAVMSKYDLIQHYSTEHDLVIQNLGRGPISNYFREVSASDEVAANDGDDNVVKIEGGFKCRMCDYFSRWKGVVETHFPSLHRRKFSCSQCSVILTKYEMIQHYENAHGLVLEKSGKGHMRKFFNPIDDVSESVNVSVHADDLNDFSAQGSSSTMNLCTNANSDSKTIIQEGSQFKCSICGFSTGFRHNLTPHFETCHRIKYSCNNCSVVMTKYEMIQHYESSHSVSLDKLGRGFMGKYFQKVDDPSEGEDESVHNDDMADSSAHNGLSTAGILIGEDEVTKNIIKEHGEFKCSICGHSTAFKSNLYPHFESFHRKKYSCNRCSIVTTKYGMICHYENTHSFVIPNFGKGKLGPYCKAVNEGELSEVVDQSIFAEGMVETVINDSVTDEVDGGTEHNVDIDKSGKGVKTQYFAEVGQAVESDGDDLVTDSCDGNLSIAEEDREFKCSICSYSSNSRLGLDCHLNAHHKKKFSCNQCSIVLTKYEMVKHCEADHAINIHHQGLGPGSRMNKYCTAVDQASGVADASDLAPTPMIESDAGDNKVGSSYKYGDKFRCSICDYSSIIRRDTENHFISLHKKKFSCNHCSVVLTKYDMMHHFESDHNVEIPNEGRGRMAKYFTPVDEDTNVTGLAHYHTRTSTSSCISDLTSVAEVEITDALKCTSCDYTPKWRTNLMAHVENMHTRRFICQCCSIILTKHDMIQHFEKKHGIYINKLSSKHSEHFVEVAGEPKSIAVSERFISAESVNKDHDDTGLPTGSSALKGTVDDNADNPGMSSSLQVTGGLTMFKCQFCNYSSKLRIHLNLHTKNMHSTKQSCNLCSEVMTKHELITHLRTVHCSKPNSSCEVEQPIPDSSHRVNNDGDDAQASAVMIQPASSTSLIDPTSTSFGEANKDIELYLQQRYSSNKYDDVSDAEAMQARKTFNCSDCDFTTKTKWYLKDHTEKFHCKKYLCSECPAVMTKYALIKHCKNVHRIVCTSRQPFLEFENANISASEGSRKILNYEGTSRSSKLDVSNGQSDVEEADQDDRALCSRCDFSTPHKWYLKDHLENFHMIKYSCRQCLAVMTKHDLINHMKQKHGVILKTTGKMPYAVAKLLNGAESKCSAPEFKRPKKFPCGICSFSSSHPFGLKRHVKIHHTIKYPCQHCPAVMTRHNMVKHCRVMHNMQFPENPPNLPESIDDVESSETSDITCSVASQHSASHVINPKFQAHQTVETAQSPAFQPVVLLDRLNFDVDDPTSTFSIVISTATDSTMVTNPKFHDPL